jgi:thiol-disulfide isomerase/thioredoxin
MRFILYTLALIALLLAVPSFAQTGAQADSGLPKDPKAQKSYAEGLGWLKDHQQSAALDSFKKADKQDGGHCAACRQKIIELGEKTGDYKSADIAAQEQISDAQTPASQMNAHMVRGILLLHEGSAKNKAEAFADADKEFKIVLASNPNYSSAYFADGMALGHLKQDDAAKAQFEQFVRIEQKAGVERARATRYIERPELVRARLAPAFAATTIDGKHVSLDDLTGKVVLIDFWATWCGPCREALPHMRKIAQKFAGEPLVILSVSLDDDANDAKWRAFVAQNQMTWLQVRDGGWTGFLATRFGVTAIPHTFTIDADGVLQDEHIGDSSIEGKLKKLCEEARRLQEAPPKQAIAAGQ